MAFSRALSLMLSAHALRFPISEELTSTTLSMDSSLRCAAQALISFSVAIILSKMFFTSGVKFTFPKFLAAL